MLSDLEKCEKRVWDALVQGDQTTDASLLDDSFLGVYADGFATKADHVGQLDNGPTILNYELSDLRAQAVAPDVWVLSYYAQFQRPGRDTNEAMYVSSIWQKRALGWVNTFSQDTAAEG